MALFAARYARALAEAVNSAQLNIADVQQQLDDFSATFAAAKDLREVLLNPTIPVRKRVTVLDAVSRRSGLAPVVRNFLAVLIEHERLVSLDDVLAEYRLENNRRQKISEAEVITARQLAEQERADLEKHLTGLAGTAVRATFREDQSLIGGAVVRIGSTIYDGSIRGRLDQLRDRLAAD